MTHRSDTEKVQVIDSKITRLPLSLVDGEGSAHAVLRPENGGNYRTMNIIDLKSGSRTIDLSHAEECVYYIVKGGGVIRDLATDEHQPLEVGSMIHIGPKDAYRLEANADGMNVIGGCVPADPALYDYVQEGAAQ